MNKRKEINFITLLLYIILIVLIIGIGYFVIYIYRTEIMQNATKIVSVSSQEINEDVIKLKHLGENNLETDIVQIEPASTINDSNTVNTTNKFYYNQLDSYSKMIYDGLNNNKESLKTGNAQIDLPNEFAKYLSTDEAHNKAESLFTIAINAFEYDNPDIYYIDYSKIVLYYESNSFGRYKAYINCGDEENYFIDGFNNKEDVENTQKKLDDIYIGLNNDLNQLHSDYDKIKYIHDWIVKNTTYDRTVSRSNRSNICGVLLEKQATCGGYAKTFKYIMDRLNINSIVIQGEASRDNSTENHAWNYVELNGKWYAIDCTWDDPIVEGVSEEHKKIYYDFFLKNEDVFKNHKKFETFYGTDLRIEYPELSINDY